MTQKTKALLAQIEEELSALPEDEQEAYLDELLQALRRRKQENGDQDVKPYDSFRVLKNAQFSGEPDESTTYEQSLYNVDEGQVDDE